MVLVAVADNEALRTFVHGQRDHQLRLRTRLKPVVEILAGRHDLVDHFAQLIHLDREYPPIVPFVPFLLNRLRKHFVQLRDPMPQEILKTDHQGCLQAHPQSLLHHVEDADSATIDQRLHIHESIVINRNVARAPAFETVVFFGLGGRPGG